MYTNKELYNLAKIQSKAVFLDNATMSIPDDADSCVDLDTEKKRLAHIWDEVHSEGGENMTKIVNCTPHAITFVDGKGETIRTIQPSGIIPRVATTYAVAGTIDGIPDEETVYGEVENLPEPEGNTILIVSALVANAVKNRADLRIPGRQVRDENGRVIGCQSLSRVK